MISIVLWCFMISSSLYAQEEIVWSKRNTVEWKDFKAHPQMQLPQAASINTGIQYSW